MNIYVGNLSYNTTDEDLRKAFSAYGDVQKSAVIIDRDTNRSKGFGFVEMGDSAAAQRAIKELNGKDMDGRALKVNESKPREQGGGGGGSRGRDGGGGGGGGGGRY